MLAWQQKLRFTRYDNMHSPNHHTPEDSQAPLLQA